MFLKFFAEVKFSFELRIKVGFQHADFSASV